MLELVDEDIYENDELKHWGILGMHWGIRRFQNPDGSLTPEGRERYGVKTANETKSLAYSQKYETLKNKKDRTEKEEKEFEDLDIGRKLLENGFADPDKFAEDISKLPKDMQQEYANLTAKYLETTNFGKGVQFSSTMMAIPLGALGLAADAGIAYMQSKAGLQFYVIPGLTFIMGAVGSDIGKGLYFNKNADAYEQAHTSKYGKRKYKKVDSGLQKYIKEDTDWVKKNYEGAIAYDPMSNIVARSKGRDYSDTDKRYTEWQKQHIRDYAKKTV